MSERDRPAAYEEKDGFVQVQCLVTYPIAENLRCIELATGQVVYEFWTDGKKGVRIDADAYDHALAIARQKMHQEARHVG